MSNFVSGAFGQAVFQQSPLTVSITGEFSLTDANNVTWVFQGTSNTIVSSAEFSSDFDSTDF